MTVEIKDMGNHWIVGPHKLDKRSCKEEWVPLDLLDDMIFYRYKVDNQWHVRRAQTIFFIIYIPKPREVKMKAWACGYAGHQPAYLTSFPREWDCSWPATGFDAATGEVIFTEPEKP